MTTAEKAIAAYLAGDLGGVRAAYRLPIVDSDDLDGTPCSERTLSASCEEITAAPRKAA